MPAVVTALYALGYATGSAARGAFRVDATWVGIRSGCSCPTLTHARPPRTPARADEQSRAMAANILNPEASVPSACPFGAAAAAAVDAG